MSRTLNTPVVYPFVEESKLVIEKGMTGATGNIYAGLHEFEDMMFLLHLLRPGDLFVDVGANIGSYTVLASAVAMAQAISIEPVPKTFSNLKRNVAVNDLESRVELHNYGIGNESGVLRFTRNLDTINHVISSVDAANDSDSIEVQITTIDDMMQGRIPLLIKIDVEGFELAVLEGARQTLSNTHLNALIIELNGSCRRYGVNESDIHEFLVSSGFTAATYFPFERRLNMKESFNPHSNTIYVRDQTLAQQRLAGARKFRVLNQDI
ncbi:MAG: FkbM family methyltransferase [Chitinophagales bacterium]